MAMTLDDCMDHEPHAVTARVALQVSQLTDDLATARAEAEGLAQAVYRFLLRATMPIGVTDELPEVKLRAAEILGYEGAAQAAREQMARQG